MQNFTLEGCIDGTCFKRKIQVRDSLLPKVWAETRTEGQMQTAERVQGLLDFKNKFRYVIHI